MNAKMAQASASSSFEGKPDEAIRVFVASSREALDIARAIQSNLHDVGTVAVWDNSAFRISEYNLNALERELLSSTHAIFVLQPDDISLIRKNQHKTARDNVIFELGLFMGKFGLGRTYLVQPEDTKAHLPTDLSGLTVAKYKPGPDIYAAIGPACTAIRNKIKQSMPRNQGIEWGQFATLTSNLLSVLKRSPGNGGYRFDVIVGINRGGIIVADLISRACADAMPILSICADRRSSPHVFDHWINANVVQTLAHADIKNILIVDDVVRNGETLSSVREFLKVNLQQKSIRTAALIVDKSAKDGIADYFVLKASTENILTPFSIFD